MPSLTRISKPSMTRIIDPITDFLSRGPQGRPPPASSGLRRPRRCLLTGGTAGAARTERRRPSRRSGTGHAPTVSIRVMSESLHLRVSSAASRVRAARLGAAADAAKPGASDGRSARALAGSRLSRSGPRALPEETRLQRRAGGGVRCRTAYRLSRGPRGPGPHPDAGPGHGCNSRLPPPPPRAAASPAAQRSFAAGPHSDCQTTAGPSESVQPVHSSQPGRSIRVSQPIR